MQDNNQKTADDGEKRQDVDMEKKAADETTDDGLYVIEKIVGKRKSTVRMGGGIEYRVRWKDYGADDDTWEEAEKLEGFDCVTEFEDRLANRGAKRTSDGEEKEQASDKAIIPATTATTTTTAQARKRRRSTMQDNSTALTADDSVDSSASAPAKKKGGPRKKASLPTSTADPNAGAKKGKKGVTAVAQPKDSTTTATLLRDLSGDSSKKTATASVDDNKEKGVTAAQPKASTITAIRLEDLSGDSTESVSAGATKERGDTGDTQPTASTTTATQKEGSTDDDVLRLEQPFPGKHYKVQDGVAVEQILGVAAQDGKRVALVQYQDSSLEIIPTEVLADHCAKLVISYYEDRLVVAA